MRAYVAIVALTLGLSGTIAPLAAAPVLQIPSVPDTTFRHATHESVGCLECHRMAPTHGLSRVRNISDCRSCHHSPARADAGCVTCHVVPELNDVEYEVVRDFALSVRTEIEERAVPFRHADHTARDCADCHEEGPSLSVPELDCRSCHEEHHAETASGCEGCHQEPAESAHPVAVHMTCSGSGCHQDPPLQTPRVGRTGCLWCHEEQGEHEPEDACVDCHVMPERQPSSSDAG